MARFFKPLLGAVALAAATLTSTGAFAAYAYNAQVSITAPKGSTAEAAAKDKSKPTGIKLSTCAAKITSVTPNILNIDSLNFSVKYDAGKAPEELGDVYVLFENLNPTATNRYITVSRAAGLGAGTGLALGVATTAVNLHTLTPAPFLAATDNLGSGAQTELLFGSSLNLNGLDKGLWALHLIIAKPATTITAAGALTASAFSFGHPETWVAYDTAVFALGSPLPLDAVSVPAANAGLVDYAGAAALAGNTTGSLVCQ
ncbi:MAG: hypothetical protein K2Y10_07150 [Burkholderiaceae bacterium]|nr:hypothetical protein [Burkholderiaceae bacterium]